MRYVHGWGILDRPIGILRLALTYHLNWPVLAETAGGVATATRLRHPLNGNGLSAATSPDMGTPASKPGYQDHGSRLPPSCRMRRERPAAATTGARQRLVAAKPTKSRGRSRRMRDPAGSVFPLWYACQRSCSEHDSGHEQRNAGRKLARKVRCAAAFRRLHTPALLIAIDSDLEQVMSDAGGVSRNPRCRCSLMSVRDSKSGENGTC